jgi:hypothetical protein
MNLNAAALRIMASKGLTLEDVAEIVAANEKGRDNTNAERQARHRAKRKEGNSNAVTVTPVTPPNDIDNLTPREGNSEPKGSSQKFVLPADIPSEPWDGWVEMRRRLRKNPTDKAKTLAVAELRRLRDEDGWPPGEVLNHCTMNSYQGIFPPSRKSKNERSDNPIAAAVQRLSASY